MIQWGTDRLRIHRRRVEVEKPSAYSSEQILAGEDRYKTEDTDR